MYYDCPHCKKSVSVDRDPPPSVIDCDECGKRYSMLGALNYHRLTTHRGVVHACKTCGKRFMTKPG